MLLGERILLLLSRKPENDDYKLKTSEITTDSSLDLLRRVYPNLDELVSGKRVLDFGCGTGHQSIALVENYACSVVGVDSNIKTLNTAIANAQKHNISPVNLSFVEEISSSMKNNFDVVISQNSFEHFENPSQILDDMRQLINDTGIILLTFGPPWFAPYGSHMHFFCKFPWINILFSERTVMKVRSNFRSDGAMKYEDVESGLNKMTINKFESIVSSHNLEIKYKKYDCVKGINWLSKLPLIRELFIKHVTVILAKED